MAKKCFVRKNTFFLFVCLLFLVSEVLNVENLNHQLKISLHLTFKFPRLLKRSFSNVSRYALERSLKKRAIFA